MPKSKKTVQSKAFQTRQREFSRFVRDAQQAVPAGLDPKRMQLYRELVFNNINDILSHALPVLHAVLDTAVWHALVRDFITEHESQSQRLHELPHEFVAYLQQERDNAGDPGFLVELAYYELLELALELAEFEPDTDLNPDGDLLTEKPYVSPYAWLQQYEYPVHKIGPDFIPDEPGEHATFLVVYRNHDDETAFMALNDVSARLLQLLQQAEVTSGQEAIEIIVAELQHPEPEMIIAAGLEQMQQFKEVGIVLGTQTPS